MLEPTGRLVVRATTAVLVAMLVFGFELSARAEDSDLELPSPAEDFDFEPPVPDERVTFDTSALALGVTAFNEYDDFRKNLIHYATGLGVAYDALDDSRHLGVAVGSDIATFWGHLDVVDEDGGHRTRALETLLRVDFRAGIAWWVGSRWRVDHQLGLGPCLTWFAYDEEVDNGRLGLLASFRTLVNWRVWDHVGLVGGPVVTIGGLGQSGDTGVMLELAELRAGVSWEPG